MKIPLHYQITEYDCGPTSLLNGLSFLFEREEIHPYSFGPYETREAILLFNGQTVLTEEKTVEYMI